MILIGYVENMLSRDAWASMSQPGASRRARHPSDRSSGLSRRVRRLPVTVGTAGHLRTVWKGDFKSYVEKPRAELLPELGRVIDMFLYL